MCGVCDDEIRIRLSSYEHRYTNTHTHTTTTTTAQHTRASGRAFSSISIPQLTSFLCLCLCLCVCVRHACVCVRVCVCVASRMAKASWYTKRRVAATEVSSSLANALVAVTGVTPTDTNGWGRGIAAVYLGMASSYPTQRHHQARGGRPTACPTR